MAARSALETERRDATALDDAALADLARHFRGELIRPGDPPYDAARASGTVRSIVIPLVARCTGVADVRAAVRFARERDLLVACEAAATTSPAPRCAMGAVIDLSPMKGVGRSGRSNGASAAGTPLGRVRPRDPGLRARHPAGSSPTPASRVSPSAGAWAG